MTSPAAGLRLGLNIGSSYANIGLMALVTLLVVPIYVNTLGPSQWGTVSLCMTVQGVLFSIDVALGPLMLRDIARGARRARAHRVYAQFLRLYGGIALGLFACGQAAVSWLQLSPAMPATTDAGALHTAMRIVLVQFLFQFANNAAIGYWNGLERQRFANLRLGLFLVARHALALLLVTQWAPTAIAYLLPFAAIAALEFGANAWRVWRETRHDRDMDAPGRANPRGSSDAASPPAAPSLPSTAPTAHRSAPAAAEPPIDWRGFATYGIAAALGVVTTQIDRIYLSLMLPAEQYGVYFLACSLILSLLQLQVPIHRAFLPRIATDAAPQRTLRTMLKVSLALLVLPCLALAIFPELVLRLWLHSPSIAAAGATPLRLMLVAVALIALYAPMSALLLTEQRYRTMIAINGTVLAAQSALLIMLTPRIGMTAGGCAWLACGAIEALVAAYLWRGAGAPGRAPAGSGR